MINKIRQAQESEKGFTLVELLVVIIIIGILAAVAIPAFLNQRQRANDAAVQADVKNVATQIETAIIGQPNARFIGASQVNRAVTLSIGPNANGSGSADVTPDINLTEGVKVRVNGSANAYTIVGTHSNGKRYNEGRNSGLAFDSAAGGMQATVAPWVVGTPITP